MAWLKVMVENLVQLTQKERKMGNATVDWMAWLTQRDRRMVEMKLRADWMALKKALHSVVWHP
jgi:hypothetical protein